MGILPNVTQRGRVALLRRIVEITDEKTYIRCHHEGGGTSEWRFNTPDNLMRPGEYEPWTWVLHIDDGSAIPSRDYPIDEEDVPEAVRALRRPANAAPPE